jgi:peptidoglycan/LPS O-acetylase OafA/YrhL
MEKRVSPATLLRSQRILARLMPDAQAEALVGDLIEEYQLRLHAAPGTAARWYWKQFAVSLPSLLWASARRGAWLTTAAAAVVCFIAAGVLEFVFTAAVMAIPASMFVQTFLSLLAGVVALVAGGYVAASIRPEAARLLALLVLVVTCVLMATFPGSGPLWYQRAFLVFGPLSPIAGAALSAARRTAEEMSSSRE